MTQAFLPNLASLHLEPTGADRDGGKRPMTREDDSHWRRKSASAKDVPRDFGMRQLNAMIEDATRGGQRLTKEQVEQLIDKVLLWFLEEEDWVMDFVFYNIHLTRAVEQVLLDLLEVFEGSGSDSTKKGDGIVTLDEWIGYYEEVSSSIDTDDYFGAMIVSTWRCLKVLSIC